MILSCLSGGLLNCSTVLTSPKSTHPAVGRYKIPNRRHLSLTRKPITIRFSSINRHQLVTPPSANSPKSSRHKDLPELRVKPRTDITRDLDGPTKIAISNDEFVWIGGQDLRFFFSGMGQDKQLGGSQGERNPSRLICILFTTRSTEGRDGTCMLKSKDCSRRE
jgi:hypothetical protein